jgi:hypothetical protein
MKQVTNPQAKVVAFEVFSEHGEPSKGIAPSPAKPLNEVLKTLNGPMIRLDTGQELETISV